MNAAVDCSETGKSVRFLSSYHENVVSLDNLDDPPLVNTTTSPETTSSEFFSMNSYLTDSKNFVDETVIETKRCSKIFLIKKCDKTEFF